MRERPLRVLEFFEPPEGGVPQHVADLADGMSRHGIEIVAAGPAGATVRARLEAGGHRFVPLPIVGSVPAPKEDVRTLRRLASLLAAEHFDLVHTHAQKAGILGRVAALRARVPALYTPHSLVYRTQHLRAGVRAPHARRLLGLAIERTLGRRSAAIIAVAEEERRAAIENGLAPPERIHVVNNGVACDQEAPPDDMLLRFRGGGPLFGLVASLRDQKGLPTLLDALELLTARGAAPRFAIVGNGPMRQEVEHRVRSGALADTTLLVPFAGKVEPYLAALDVFVLPSYWEGLPIAVLEAMAMGLPVVATAVNGTPEAVIDGETGWLVPSHDAAALADRLTAMSADPAARARMGARAREVALERFTVEQMVDKTLDLYLRLSATRA